MKFYLSFQGANGGLSQRFELAQFQRALLFNLSGKRTGARGVCY